MNNRNNRPWCTGVGKQPTKIKSKSTSVFIPSLGYPVHYLGRGNCPDCDRIMSFRAIDNPTNNPRTGMLPHLSKKK